VDTRPCALNIRMQHPWMKPTLVMSQFVINGFHLMLHLKVEFMSLRNNLAFGIFFSDTNGGEVLWCM
jgi:hypothetical protein